MGTLTSFGQARGSVSAAIDLYYLHRVDSEVPLEDSWGAMASHGWRDDGLHTIVE